MKLVDDILKGMIPMPFFVFSPLEQNVCIVHALSIKGGDKVEKEGLFTYDITYIDLRPIQSTEDLYRLMEFHDRSSLKYCIHTGLINLAIAKVYGIQHEKELKQVYDCGLFHDVGKLGMSYEFLNYPGSYTIQMYKEMKKHAEGGASLLLHVNASKPLVDTARYHHCNYDGTGYPGNLFGEDIPLHARITRISDSVDAYLSKRCYKDGGPANETLADLMQFSGTSYDPSLLEAFAKVHRQVMGKCHADGVDHPSQSLYMGTLQVLYGQM